MLDRKLIGLTLKVGTDRSGLSLDVDRRLVESSLSSGQIVYEHERYECLSASEFRDVVEVILDGPMPGDRSISCRGEQLALLA